MVWRFLSQLSPPAFAICSLTATALTNFASPANVYYLAGKFSHGVWTELRMSFERPDHEPKPSARQYQERAFSRSPSCAPVLADLTRKYGQPTGPVNSSEEALEHHAYLWKQPEGELQLVCGNYQTERFVFAMDIYIKPSGH